MNSAKALFLALLLAACGSSATSPFDAATPDGDVVATLLAPGVATARAPLAITLVPDPTPIPTSVPTIQRTSWLLLGGDHSAYREGTGYGDKTDVIVLVSVLESDPAEITIVQFPRNLYVKTSLEDQWLFAVWGQEGWQGLHQWFNDAMGVSLQGIFYVDMDGFVQIVDDLGGLVPWGLDRIDHSGEGILEYLRDNDNNWGRDSYDDEQRVFGVLMALADRIVYGFLDDPIAGTDLILSNWRDLIKTDLASIDQWYWLARLAFSIWNDHNYGTEFIQLKEPYITRGDTPLEVRGMIPNLQMLPRTYSLHAWWIVCVEGRGCEDG